MKKRAQDRRITVSFPRLKDKAYHQTFIDWLKAREGRLYGHWLAEQERRYYEEHTDGDTARPA